MPYIREEFNCAPLNRDGEATYGDKTFLSQCYKVDDQSDIKELLGKSEKIVPEAVTKAFIKYVSKVVGENSAIVLNKDPKAACPFLVVSSIECKDEGAVFVSAYPHLTKPDPKASSDLAGSKWHITDVYTHKGALSRSDIDYNLAKESSEDYKPEIKDRVAFTIDVKTGNLSAPTRENLAAILKPCSETKSDDSLFLYKLFSVSSLQKRDESTYKATRGKTLDCKSELQKFRTTIALTINNDPVKIEETELLSPNRTGCRGF